MQSKEKVFQNKYRVIEEMAKSTQSKVFKVRDLLTDNVFALKLYNLNTDKERNRKFALTEIATLKELSGLKNVIQIRDSYISDNEIFMVSDFYSYNLKNFYIENSKNIMMFQSKENKMVLEKVTVYFLKQIISSFMSIWEKNIIHRDLKVQNIMIENGALYIIDFGICTREAVSNAQLGTPSHFSMERSKQKDYDYTEDIYQIGVVCICLLLPRELILNDFKNESINNSKKIIEKNHSKEMYDFLYNGCFLDKERRLNKEALLNHPILRKYSDDDLFMNYLETFHFNLIPENINVGEIFLEIVNQAYEQKLFKAK